MADEHKEALKQMTYADFGEYIQNKERGLQSHIGLIVMFMQEKPQISKFSEDLLEARFDKVKVKDHINYRGKHTVLEPPTSRYIAKTPEIGKTRILNQKTSVPLREEFTVFQKREKKRKANEKKAASKTPVKKRKQPWIEYQIGGKVPCDLTIKQIDTIPNEILDRKLCVI